MKKVNLLINLLPIKKGGGQQVATNFITQLPKFNHINAYFLVTKGTIVEEYVSSIYPNNYVSIENSLIKRILFTTLGLSKIIKAQQIDILYTMFGPGIFYKNIPSVTGCAYSNLFFPETDFWAEYSLILKYKFKIRDYFRLKATLRSNAIIFENEAMRKRCIDLFKYPKENTILILPSISEYHSKINTDFSLLINQDNDPFRIAFITGYHKNKNLEIIPQTLEALVKKGWLDFEFVITISKDNPEIKHLITKLDNIGLSHMVCFIGPIRPEDIPSLMQNIHGVGLFSLLESFSNNIIEAWHFRKPLFISNEEWAKSICGNAAFYVDRTNPDSIAETLINFRLNQKSQVQFIEDSKKNLKCFPNPKEKIERQMEFIHKIYNQHKPNL